MAKHVSCNKFINYGFLLSSLLLLSGCAVTDWIKKQTKCTSSCSSKSGSCSSGDVLATLDGLNPVTTKDHEEQLELLIKQEPQMAALLNFMPDAELQIFNGLVHERLMSKYMEDSGIKDSKEYKEQKKAIERGIEQALNGQFFGEEIKKKIDQSDTSVEAFYKAEQTQNPGFQRPPFIKSEGGVKAQSIQFSNKKEAQDFLAKAKSGSNFANLAKDAKKSVNNFGGEVINSKSKNIDAAVKMQLSEVQSVPAFELVESGKNFFVVNVTAKINSQYAPFNEVKDAVKNVYLQSEGGKVYEKTIEDLKAKYKLDDSKAKHYFDKKKQEKHSNMQDQLKAMQQDGAEETAQPKPGVSAA